MRRMIPTAAAVTALILGGLVHGLWTDRWVNSEAAARAAARLDDISLNLGDWKGERTPVDAGELQGVAGYFLAPYVNSRDGHTVTVFVVAGRPGPVAEHTPDVCYKGSGYKITSTRSASFASDLAQPAEFRTAVLIKKQSADQNYLRIYWGWNATGSWSAPDNPRLTFAGNAALYKMYVIRELSTLDDTGEDEPCREFLRDLLPELQRALFATPDLP
jgi:hypothetical protein